MNPLLEERLRAVYPKGYLELIDVDQCDFSWLDPLEAMLRARLAPWHAGFDRFLVWSQVERVASLKISLWAADGVPWNCGNTQLQQRLDETGQPGVVCFLTVSTVYPAWNCYFNLFTRRDDPTGTSPWGDHPDCAMLKAADAPPVWNSIDQAIGECCAAYGLVRLDNAELQEDVLFVTQSMWSDDDDDDDDDVGDDGDDFTPSPQQLVCNVAQCLFQQH